MIGIKAYGGYVPYYRLTKATIAAAYGKSGKGGEKAVAYYDEDSVTMAAGAAMNAVPRAEVGNCVRRISAIRSSAAVMPCLRRWRPAAAAICWWLWQIAVWAATTALTKMIWVTARLPS